MIKNSTLIQYFNEGNMEKLKEALEKNVREEAIKDTGKKTNKLKLVEKFYKSIDDYRPKLKSMILTDDGYYALCDGFRLIWSRESFGLPTLPESEAVRVSSIISGCKPKFTVKVSDILEDLTVYTKTYKLKDRYKNPPFDIKFGDDFVGVNGHWLLEAIKFTEAETIEIESDHAPITLHGKNDYHALVLPIRK